MVEPRPSDLTWQEHEAKSKADWLACAPHETREAFWDGLSDHEISALPYLFDFWAMDHQIAPQGNWRSWVILGGRGAGKTRAGAEWVRAMVEGDTATAPGRAMHVALVGETLDQAREIMVFGESGILACSPPDRRPQWISSRRMLLWPNGATAQIFSAQDPEALRGPQFDAAWVDELAKWKKADEAWDMLQFALRLGDHPQQVVTTTPQNTGLLNDILEAPTTEFTHAPTEVNRANLASSFLEEVQRKYQGTRRGRQELGGELLDGVEGALWSHLGLEAARIGRVPDFSRIIVSVDPPVTGHAGSDACGIVVAGAVTDGPPQDWYAVVLEDVSVQGLSATDWAKRVLETYRRYDADRVVAEVNQGGDLVETLLRQIDPNVSYAAVRATLKKGQRAEPVAALYEQGRVKHVPGLHELEDQMVLMTPQNYLGRGSPDRVDALVWAVHELILAPSERPYDPRVRAL